MTKLVCPQKSINEWTDGWKCKNYRALPIFIVICTIQNDQFPARINQVNI